MPLCVSPLGSALVGHVNRLFAALQFGMRHRTGLGQRRHVEVVDAVVHQVAVNLGNAGLAESFAVVHGLRHRRHDEFSDREGLNGCHWVS